MDTEARAGIPAWLLMISGGVIILYSLVYLLWTLFTVAWPVVAAVGSVMDGNDLGGAIGAAVMMIAVPLLQILGFCVTTLMGAVTAFGGVRLDRYRSKGLVYLAIFSATAAPLLALIVNAGSALNIGSCGIGCLTGCLFGNIPTAVVLLLGFVSSVFAVVHLMEPQNARRFAGVE